MATLHVIGNGFDLSHGFETSYNDFKKYATKKDSNWTFQFEGCFLGPARDLWSDLERAIGNLDFDGVFNEATEDIEPEEDHEIRYIPQMEDAPEFYLGPIFKKFHELFEDWVCSIKIHKGQIRNIPYFDPCGLFISFNYTETMEEVYGIPRDRINYIHGKRYTDDKLIVGHNKREVNYNDLLSGNSEIYEYEAYKGMTRIFNEQRKDLSCIYDDVNCSWHSLACVNKIVIYGHSLNEIDMPYFEKIANDATDGAEWYFSIYYDDERQRENEIAKVTTFCNSIGISMHKCHTFLMPQYYD